MKQIILFITLTVLTFSCQESSKKDDSIDIKVSTKNIEKNNTSNVEVLETNVIQTGEYIELYPNGKVQTEGWNNAEGLRDGIWYSYYENGVKWSESSYKNGVKDGYSIVFFHNGKVRYMGDYKNDEKTGHWVFYNEDGDIETEKDY